jgi:hypothetical protein
MLTRLRGWAVQHRPQLLAVHDPPRVAHNLH